MSQVANWTIKRKAGEIVTMITAQLALMARLGPAMEAIEKNMIAAKTPHYELSDFKRQAASALQRLAGGQDTLGEYLQFFQQANPEDEFALDIEDAKLMGFTSREEMVASITEAEKLAADNVHPVTGEPLAASA